MSGCNSSRSRGPAAENGDNTRLDACEPGSEESSCYTLTINVEPNRFGDRLPIIPSESRVSSGKVLYRLQIKTTLTRGNQPAAGEIVRLNSTRSTDTINPQEATTDNKGECHFTVETRDMGELILSAESKAPRATLQLNLREAWYEEGFYVTHYNVAHEADFNGSLVSATGLNEAHRDDFLYSGRGVAMQGTGMDLAGRFITVTNPTQLYWQPRYTWLRNPNDARFTYVTSPQGRYNPVVAGTSIAIDPTVIPPRHRVYIESADRQRVIGNRRGDDTGGGIDGHHIDVFMGAGASASATWQQQGGNLHGARVRYLGP